MSWFSSGKKWKRRAERTLNTVRDIEDYQSEVEFRRQLLSNIRQERIARAQLEVGNYSTTARTSSQQGAIANIDSSLAGEADFSYSSSERQQQMTDLTRQAERYYKKYQKQQKKRATAFSVAGLAAGALTGGVLGAAGMLGAGVGGLSGSLMGSQIGQGFGQIASGTGQWQQGLGNILSGGTGLYSLNQVENNYQKYLNMIRMNRYQLSSVDPQTNQIIPGSTVYAGNYMVLQGIRGYRS